MFFQHTNSNSSLLIDSQLRYFSKHFTSFANFVAILHQIYLESRQNIYFLLPLLAPPFYMQKRLFNKHLGSLHSKKASNQFSFLKLINLFFSFVDRSYLLYACVKIVIDTYVNNMSIT